jgi:hypothetical protein
MTKREAAKKLRSLLTRAIRSLPDDIEYKCVSVHEDFTSKTERDREEAQGVYDDPGALHTVELTVEEDPGRQE